jgi:hypothetical protein
MLGRPKTAIIVEKVVVRSVEYSPSIQYLPERPNRPPLYKCTEDFDIEACFYDYEYIVLENFVNPDQSVSAIGMTKQAAEALMIPFGQWPYNLRRMSEMEDKLQRGDARICSLEMQNEALRDRLNRYKTLSFWQRLKFLFGVDNDCG